MLSSRRDNRPSFQLYPKDWLSECALRRCSLAARGLWAELLMHMWLGNPRGACSMSAEELAQVVGGADEAGMARLLSELERNGVCTRLDEHTICCRRMYREELDLRLQRKRHSEAGKAGAAARWGGDAHGKGMAKMASSSSSASASASSPKSRRVSRQADPLPVGECVKTFLSSFPGEGEGAPAVEEADAYVERLCALAGDRSLATPTHRGLVSALLRDATGRRRLDALLSQVDEATNPRRSRSYSGPPVRNVGAYLAGSLAQVLRETQGRGGEDA